MLVGSQDFIARARRARKMLGGGMRQCGLLAAAGLIALEDGPPRLHRDHAHAQAMAAAFAGISGVVIDPRRVETNVVHVTVRPPLRASALVAAVAQQGLLVTSVDDQTVRLVTHQDVTRDECLDAVAIIERYVTAHREAYESAALRAHS
jgi:threonine aldolase